MKIGILTGGGDCPGLNAVIRAAVRKGTFHYDDEFVGFLEGWRGLVEDKSMPLDLEAVAGILPRGGTILRTSRTNPAKKADGLDKCVATMKRHGTDALIAIGGDDTLSVATKLFDRGVKVVGVPKTIDNDLAGTDFTFGFDTAVNVVTEAIDRVHTTAEAHNRVMVACAMLADVTSALWSWPKAQNSPPAKMARSCKAVRRTSSVMLGSAGSQTPSPKSWKGAQDLKHAPWCWATFSVADHLQLSIGCWPHATA
jgi:hypothetical protein